MIDRLKADKLVKTTDSGKQFHRHSASEKVLSDTLIYSKMHTETQTDRQTDRETWRGLLCREQRWTTDIFDHIT